MSPGTWPARDQIRAAASQGADLVLLVPANSATGLEPDLLDVIDYWRQLR